MATAENCTWLAGLVAATPGTEVVVAVDEDRGAAILAVVGFAVCFFALCPEAVVLVFG